MRRSDDIAKRPQIRISVAKRCQNSGSTKGAAASTATTRPKPIQYDGLGPMPRARVSSARSDAAVGGRAALMVATRAGSFRSRHEETGGADEERDDERDER